MHAPGRRFGDAAQDFQQRALARAVASNDSHHLPALHLKRNIFEAPKNLRSNHFWNLGSARWRHDRLNLASDLSEKGAGHSARKCRESSHNAVFHRCA